LKERFPEGRERRETVQGGTSDGEGAEILII
jgi:hypothetical protein